MLFLVIGASGVGKTTLIRRCVNETWPNQWHIYVPPKHTTRPPRAGEEAEYVNLSDVNFSENSQKNLYLLEYCLFGYRYGIPRIPFERATVRDSFYIQTYPTDVSRELILRLGRSWKSYVCLLEADLSVVRSRLHQRSDSHTRRTVKQRLATANRDRRFLADISMSANGTAEEVFKEFQRWIVTTLTLDGLI
jgi:guanylate kinase